MKYKSTLALIAAILGISSAVSYGQDKATLDLLVSKGVITRQEADAVSKKSVMVSPKEKTTKSVKLIGRVQTQYENITTDETVGGVKNELGTKSDFLMRRIFLGMNADLGSGWSATVIADFCRSDANYLEYAYITKKYDGEFLSGTADIGYKKIKFNLEEYTSASKLLSIERSLASRYFSEGNNGRRLGLGGRHTGLYWEGETPVDGLQYGLSITNSYSNNPSSIPDGARDGLLYAANVSYSGKIADAVSFQAGVNAAYTNDTNVAGTAGEHGGYIIGLNPYVKLSAYGFSLWSEFLMANMEDAKNNYTQDATPMGVNVGIEYKFDIGEFGAIAPTVRYSWIDTDGRGIKVSDGVRNAYADTSFDRGQSIYAGLNWYINGNALKFQIGYEYAKLEGSPTDSSAVQSAVANAVRAQMQVLF